MKIEILNKLINNPKLLDRFIKEYKRKGLIRDSKKDILKIKGHLEKAEHNFDFVNDNLKLGYYDWCITGCYYAVYQACLALINLKNHLSKNHNATLCILIKEYYNKGIDNKDIELINNFFLEYQDLLFYVKSKNKREEASYSTKILFDKKTVEELQKKAIKFVEKIRSITDASEDSE